PDDDELVRAEERLGRLPGPLELAPRGGEARRERGGQVVVSGNRQHRPPEPHEERMRTFVLVAAAPVGEVTGRDDERRRRPLDELGERRLDHRLLAGARVQVGHMDEPIELFDDLYLGLRAGGAIRKQRRGEPLTTEDQAALTRWQRLSQWRKAIAIGAFAVGTFGLGFTLGGLVFSRRGKRQPV